MTIVSLLTSAAKAFTTAECRPCEGDANPSDSPREEAGFNFWFLKSVASAGTSAAPVNRAISRPAGASSAAFSSRSIVSLRPTAAAQKVRTLPAASSSRVTSACAAVNSA